MVGYREGSGEECAGYQEERYRLPSHGGNEECEFCRVRDNDDEGKVVANGGW